MFQDLGNAPATLESSRIADCYGCFHGHACEQSDADQAYIQAPLKGTPTRVALPQDQWPAAWNGMRRPVCRLHKALYGHPDSGTYWEEHCDTQVLRAGFAPVLRDAWPACYFHYSLKLFLVVYVDDFKLSGPSEALAPGWRSLRQGLDLDRPEPSGLYLGCKHESFQIGSTCRGIIYNMESFFRECIDLYIQLTGHNGRFRPAAAPFLSEDMNESDVSRLPASTGGRVTECPWCKLTFDVGVSTVCLSPSCSGASCASTQSLPRGPPFAICSDS